MVVCQLGSLLMFSGLLIMGIGWWKIHRAGGNLVTSGVYRLIRHPQYLGLMSITIGMLIQWPTIVTLLMWPILMIAYYRLANNEEKDLEERFGEAYRQYRHRTRAFIPFPRFNRVKLEMCRTDNKRR